MSYRRQYRDDTRQVQRSQQAHPHDFMKGVWMCLLMLGALFIAPMVVLYVLTSIPLPYLGLLAIGVVVLAWQGARVKALLWFVRHPFADIFYPVYTMPHDSPKHQSHSRRQVHEPENFPMIADGEMSKQTRAWLEDTSDGVVSMADLMAEQAHRVR